VDTKCALQERVTQRCDFPRIAAKKIIFLHLWSPSLRLTSTCGRTDNSEIQGLATSWDNILIPAQDATQRRGAATTRREAGLGARGVKNQHGHKDQQTFKIPTLTRKISRPETQTRQA